MFKPAQIESKSLNHCFYWSSTEVGADSAWPWTGFGWGYAYKGNNYTCRAVRDVDKF